MTTYADFLAAKQARAPRAGRPCDPSEVNTFLHPWQREIVAWAVQTGRAALWEDTGLGKTVQALEWCRLSAGTSLVVAPLAVCHQTVREASRIGLTATYARSDEDVTGPGIWITNYERAAAFDPNRFGAVVLDEASILKNADGKTRAMLTDHFAPVPHRLACTATPAPNEPEELTGQAAFLGHSTRANMLAAYFVHDDTGWRLKGHARKPMFKWLSTWAVAIRRPSDMGYDDGGYVLPGINIVPHLLDIDVVPDGQLFATDLGGVGGRAAVRRETLIGRCEAAVTLINNDHGWSAAWGGSPSTPQIGAPSMRPTPSIAPSEDLKLDPAKTIASTCASTTNGKRIVTSNINGKRPTNATRDDASAMQPTPATEPNASDSQSCATRIPSGTTNSADPLESPRQSTTSGLRDRAVAAPSVGQLSGMELAGGSPSTTATPLAGSAESSAENATLASGSSRTTRSCLPAPSATSALPEPWIVWCGLNDEQDYLERAFGDRCFSVKGSQSPEEKADLLLRWVAQERPILVTKPKIAGFGMNFQHCARMAFVGLSDSMETYYQAIRRCHRYGQSRVVDVHVVVSRLESAIAANVGRKQIEADRLIDDLVREMRPDRWRAAA